MNLIFSLFCGGIIGSSMLIPGVSGGTMAIILGIYDKLVDALGNITSKKNFQQSIKFLLCFMAGASVGIYLFSSVALSVVKNHEQVAMFFFMGMIASSFPAIYKKTGATKIKISDFVCVIFGGIICFSLTFCKDSLIVLSQTPSAKNFFVIIFAGLLISVALILPGVSCSQMLLILGIYELTLDAVKNHKLGFLIPFALSVLCGILLFTGLLDKQMKKRPRVTYFLILGFMISSILDIFPKIEKSDKIWLCMLTFFIGFAIINVLSKALKILLK